MSPCPPEGGGDCSAACWVACGNDFSGGVNGTAGVCSGAKALGGRGAAGAGTGFAIFGSTDPGASDLATTGLCAGLAARGFCAGLAAIGFCAGFVLAGFFAGTLVGGRAAGGVICSGCAATSDAVSVA